LKRFQADENISGVTQLKSSVQRSIRAKLVEQFPSIKDYIDDICPKKESMVLIKWYQVMFTHSNLLSNWVIRDMLELLMLVTSLLQSGPLDSAA
jgi:isochorismate hydrolase